MHDGFSHFYFDDTFIHAYRHGNIRESHDGETVQRGKIMLLRQNLRADFSMRSVVSCQFIFHLWCIPMLNTITLHVFTKVDFTAYFSCHLVQFELLILELVLRTTCVKRLLLQIPESAFFISVPFKTDLTAHAM